MTPAEKRATAYSYRDFNSRMLKFWEHKIPDIENRELKYDLNKLIEEKKKADITEFTITMPCEEDMLSFERYKNWLIENNIKHSITFTLSETTSFILVSWFNNATEITEADMRDYMNQLGYHYVTQIAGWINCKINIEL
jgi:hypothetical protein